MNNKIQICFIINPKAGIRKRYSISEKISEWINNNNVDAKIYITQHSNHAFKLAQMASGENFDIIACAGGDGTINETARGMIGSSKALGIIPCGSGNGLARHLKIPLSINKALDNLLTGKLQSIDVIKVNDFLSFNVSGLGFDGQVAHTFARMKTRGLKNYIKSVILEYRKTKQHHLELVFQDGRIEKRTAWLMSICNASQYGNNATIAAEASCNDGLIDFVFLSKPALWQIPMLAYRLFSKTLHQSKLVYTLRSPSLSINIKEMIALHIDGEPSMAEGMLHCEVKYQLQVISNL